MELNPVLRRFAERAPLPVMARAVLERCLNAQLLDAWFEATAERQYTRTLLFSSVYELMTQVVLSQHGSVRAAWQAASEREALGVSLTSLYNKLNALEPQTSAALVAYSGAQGAELIDELQARHDSLLPGLKIKVLDGNCLDARQHRIKETRQSTAAPLPGKALAVFEPELEAITLMVPCEDGHAQERSLLPRLLEHVGAGELWLADRNFCTRGFLEELQQRGAHSLVRQHGLLRVTPLEAMREIGEADEGARVSEQWVHLGPAKGPEGLRLRRIRVQLAKPMRDGEDTLYLLSSVPPERADAVELAALYRKRWSIERAFLHLTTQLRCEVHTLSYPGATLFALACAMAAFNVLAVLKAALRAAHGQEAAETVSGYFMASDMRNMAQSLEVIVDEGDWAVFRELSTEAMAAWLLVQAGLVRLKRYARSPARKSPPKPPLKRVNDPSEPHVAVSKLIAKRGAKAP